MLQKKTQRLIGSILIDKGLLRQDQLKEALLEQKTTKEFLGVILLRGNLIRERDLFEALSEQFGIPTATIKNRYIDWKFVGRFSPSLVLEYKCLPLGCEGFVMTVAITNPMDAWALKKAEEETRGYRLKLVLVTEGEMRDVIKRYQQHIRGEFL